MRQEGPTGLRRGKPKRTTIRADDEREPATDLHVAARLTHPAPRLHLRIDKTSRWSAHIAEGFHRLRAAFT